MKHTFKKNIQNTVVYYTFDKLDKLNKIKHLFTTRLGGVSQNEFASMNLGLTRGDSKEAVEENYRRICKVLDIEVNDLVLCAQTHGINVKTVTKKDCGTGITKPAFTDVDGLVCAEKGVCLVGFFADCVPIYFLDTNKNVIALCHAGWRGTKDKIAKNVIKIMQENFSCKTKDILCAIGPSIGPCHFEVDTDISAQLVDAICDKTIITEKKGKKCFIDLWKANSIILQECGISQENIIISGICTYCESKLFFSHRATKGKRGSLAAFISLK